MFGSGEGLSIDVLMEGHQNMTEDAALDDQAPPAGLFVGAHTLMVTTWQPRADDNVAEQAADAIASTHDPLWACLTVSLPVLLFNIDGWPQRKWRHRRVAFACWVSQLADPVHLLRPYSLHPSGEVVWHVENDLDTRYDDVHVGGGITEVLQGAIHAAGDS